MAIGPTKAMTLRLSAPMATELETIARAESRTVSGAIRIAITEFIERRRQDPELNARLRLMLQEDRDMVARFVGASNILRGEVRDGVLDAGGGVSVRVDGPDGRAAYVIRPEDVKLDPDAPLRAIVADVVDAGSGARVTLSSGDRVLDAHVAPDAAPSVGEETGVDLPRRRLWRLPDDETERPAGRS